jgi:thymidylate synthase ThyX
MNKVELLGYYGSDLIHAQSAWTSTSRDITDEKKARVGKLLKMLASEGHHTPFEKSSLHFLVTVDQATHIHLIKHRIGVSILGRKRAKESARFFKTFNSQITMDVMFNWRSFYHFQQLRNSEHAQVEVRQLAQDMLDLVKQIEGNPFKETIEAFNL